MSNPRYDWWPYVKGMIRRYPALVQKQACLHDICITAKISGMPHGTGISNPTEQAALRDLPEINRREMQAVQGAIAQTERSVAGQDKMRVIQLVYWKRSHTLSGAAVELHCSEPTVKRWNGDFIRDVAKNFGLL